MSSYVRRIRIVAACALFQSALLSALCAQTSASPQTVPPGDVTGVGNFSHVVANLEKSLEFYRDVLGLDLATPAQLFAANPAIMKMGNTPSAQSRIAVLKIPGTALGVELIEYKDIDRKPAHPRFQDPGAGNLALRVWDIDAVVVRLRQAGARVLTLAGKPVAISRAEKAFFVQDPDGFIVELNEVALLHARRPASITNLIGASFELTINDTDETVKFYRDLLGFQLQIGDAFNGNKLMAETAGTPGAQFRQSSAQIPGTAVRMSFIEFKGIDRKPLHTRVQDPGTALLQLRVRDIDGLVKKLKAAGAPVISPDGEPVSVGNAKIAIVRDPNNLFLELLGTPQAK